VKPKVQKSNFKSELAVPAQPNKETLIDPGSLLQADSKDPFMATSSTVVASIVLNEKNE
jgi:hypothetical protein